MLRTFLCSSTILKQREMEMRGLRTGDYGWTSDHDIVKHWNEYLIDGAKNESKNFTTEYERQK